jgi:RimJ/RimL family protein N-acetyltransferase
LADGSEVAETEDSEGELTEKPFEAKFIEVILGDFKEFGLNFHLCWLCGRGGFDERIDEVKVGLCIFDKSAWGHGLGSKAIACVTKWATDDLDLKWIEAGIYEENIASQKAFLSAGYEWISDTSGKFILNGKSTVTKIYAKRKV